jgi:hypothetical protein
MSFLQVWESNPGSSSSECDENGNPINASFVSGQSFPLNLPWGRFTVNVEFSKTPGGILVDFSSPISRSHLFPPRYRRAYDDYTMTETGTFDVEVQEGAGCGRVAKLTLDLGFTPTCRSADLTKCVCLDLSGYNIIDLGDLESYPSDPSVCPGVPIDIDVKCEYSEFGDDEPIDGGVTMYYTPVANTVPVINHRAFDTTNLPSVPGLTSVVKIITLNTRNEIRYWVCDNLRFATITNPAAWPPSGAGSLSSSSSSSARPLLDFNWPYNDLYFNPSCGRGEVVNLVPC